MFGRTAGRLRCMCVHREDEIRHHLCRLAFLDKELVSGFSVSEFLFLFSVLFFSLFETRS